MSIRSELFASDHARALVRASALDAGLDAEDAPRVELASVTALDLETLGEIAAEVLRFGTGDLECEEVDLEHDNLVELPRFLREVLVELGTAEDPDALTDVAARWAATEELSSTPAAILPVLTDIVALATTAGREDRNVYLWVEPLL
jgi:hypothetical protein